MYTITMRKLLVVFSLCLLALTCHADNAMDTYISQLMSRMTLEEKIGQLNLLPGGDIVTGKGMNNPLAQLAKDGSDEAVASALRHGQTRRAVELCRPSHHPDVGEQTLSGHP